MFGDWNIEDARTQFQNGNRAIIDNFFDSATVDGLVSEFPASTDPGWHVYDNPLEIKLARDEFTGLERVQKAFEFLESEACLDRMRYITDVHGIEHDPHRHGAGLHCHERGGKLDMHVDYSIHPLSGKTRCLNLIVYLTPDWNPSWGGELHLGDDRIQPLFNRAVLFRVDGFDEAVHGMPFPLSCPPDVCRRSLAIYYVRDGDPLHGNKRFKARFHPMPGKQETMAKEYPWYGALYERRSWRRLNSGDLWLGWQRDQIGKDVWWLKEDSLQRKC